MYAVHTTAGGGHMIGQPHIQFVTAGTGGATSLATIVPAAAAAAYAPITVAAPVGTHATVYPMGVTFNPHHAQAASSPHNAAAALAAAATAATSVSQQQPHHQGVKQEFQQTTSGRTDYFCHDCNMTFSSANEFLEHVQHGHDASAAIQINGNVAQVIPNSSILEAAKGIFRCNFCVATFQRRDTLLEHIQSVHQTHTAHLTTAGGPHQVVVASAGNTIAGIHQLVQTGQVVVQQQQPIQVQQHPHIQLQHAHLQTQQQHLIQQQIHQQQLQPQHLQQHQQHSHLQQHQLPSTPHQFNPNAPAAPFVGSGEGLFCPDCKNPFANKYSLMKHLRSTRCRHEDETEINKIINDQLTCGKCLKQFGSIQALKKHIEVNKCQVAEIKRLPDPVVSFRVGRALTKGLVYDESIQLTPDATVKVYRCPDEMCAKPCVTFRAFKMHTKCVHKGLDIEPIMQQVKANYVCKVRGCGKLFVEEQQLDVHFKHHENYTPRVGKHRCHLCNEGFYQKDMLKKHVLSFHCEVTSFRGRMGRKSKKSQSSHDERHGSSMASSQDGSAGSLGNPGGLGGMGYGGGAGGGGSAGGAYRRLASGEEVKLKYDPGLQLAPGTLMTIYKCPVESCTKRSCTDMKSFKLHCLHIHQDKDIMPSVEEVEAKYICQVQGCGKLYLEQKQYEIHQRHHKSYVPSKGRYFRCGQCDCKFNSQGNLDVHVIQTHFSTSSTNAVGDGGSPPSNCDSGALGKNQLIFEDISLEPGTMMTVYHCPVQGCPKRNYLDPKSVRTHCRRVHGMIDFEGIPSQAEAQYICQVRGCRKLFMEQVQIEAHLKHHRTYVPTNGVFECNCCPETFTRKEQLDKHVLAVHTTEGVMRNAGIQIKKEPASGRTGAVVMPTQVHNIGVGSAGLPVVGVAGQPHLNQHQPIQTQQLLYQQPPQHNQGLSAQHHSQPQLHHMGQIAKVVGYQCSLCMRKFLHLGTHCNHVNNVHQAPGLAPIEIELKPKYTCRLPKCGRHFMTKTMFKAHMDRHTNGKSKKAMNCFKCGRNFSQFKSLYQHIVQTHEDVTPEEIAKLESSHAKCPVCLAVFRSVDIMRVHLRRHQERKETAAIQLVVPVSDSVQSAATVVVTSGVDIQTSQGGPTVTVQNPQHVQHLVSQVMQQTIDAAASGGVSVIRNSSDGP